jgi:polyferredoxin
MPEEQDAPMPTPVEQDEQLQSGAARSNRQAQRTSRRIRLGVLATILVGVTALSYLHQRGSAFKPVGVDALCPFGGVETLWSLMISGALLQRIAVSSLILLGITIVLALLFGRAFCGYLCPLGALQEFTAKLRSVLGIKKRLEVPAAADRYARLLKYLVLAFFTAWTWSAASLMIRPYDPWVAWTHLTSAELFAEFGVGAAILLVSLAGSVLYDRFFCKYLCPMGALLAVFKPIAWFRIGRNESTCIDCNACDRACPMNIEVSTASTVDSLECISCNECVNACPVSDTLTVRDRRGSALTVPAMTTAVVAITAGVLLVTTLGGMFAWTRPTAAEAIGASSGTIDVNEIRGSMSFAEIADATGIPPEVFEQQFGVQPSDMTAKIKDLAPVYGFDVHTDVRGFVQQQLDAGLGGAPTGAAGSAEED